MIARKKALIIEDEPMIRLICERVFSAEGFDVDSAANGLKAKEMIKGGDYVLCLSDILTPGMNGMELFDYLEHKHPELTGRIIFTTGDLLSPIVKQFLNVGDKIYLLKPFTPDDLREKIRQVYDGYKSDKVEIN